MGGDAFILLPRFVAAPSVSPSVSAAINCPINWPGKKLQELRQGAGCFLTHLLICKMIRSPNILDKDIQELLFLCRPTRICWAICPGRTCKALQRFSCQVTFVWQKEALAKKHRKTKILKLHFVLFSLFTFQFASLLSFQTIIGVDWEPVQASPLIKPLVCLTEAASWEMQELQMCLH